MPTPAQITLLALLLVAGPLLAADEAPEAASDSETRLEAVQVKGLRVHGYHADSSELDAFGSFGNAPIADTPAAIKVITRAEIDDRQPRTLSELVATDAAVGDNYAPVGYFQNLAIRGFPLDLATGYRMNQLAFTAEQPLALEDKERVEILAGLAGLEAGIVSPGGLVNFVTKRPADVRALVLGTDGEGSRYVAGDFGRLVSPGFGLRLNAAHEDIRSFVEHADGQRNFLALAADLALGERGLLRFDANGQRSSQRSVSGYQLLGGTALPPRVDRHRMLGFQPWQQPTRFDTLNATLRLDYRLAESWALELGAGRSRSVMDDSVAFAYGCFYSPACADGSVPGWYFAPNGDYDVYDFRSPDDTRRNDELRAVLRGAFDTGPLGHELTLGASVFHRRMDGRGWVYEYVGSSNIHEYPVPVFQPSPEVSGPLEPRLDHWQRALFALDRVHLGEHWQVLAGARRVRLDERAFDEAGEVARHTRLAKTLPQAALMFQPDARLTTYLSYGEGLAAGLEAPYWTANGGELLAPRLARQLELGAKYAPTDELMLTAALYRIRQPWQFAFPDEVPEGFSFRERGEERREGIEFDATGQLTEALRLSASLNWNRARARHSGIAAYDGEQMVNVPALRTALWLDWRLPLAPDLALLAGWRHASRNPATPDGRTSAPAWDVFDLGLRYRIQAGASTLTWRLNVDNLFDRFYWRDTGSTLGDSYAFPGNPRQVRLTLTWELP